MKNHHITYDGIRYSKYSDAGRAIKKLIAMDRLSWWQRIVTLWSLLIAFSATLPHTSGLFT